MTTKEIKQISMIAYLSKLGYQAAYAKKNNNEFWYLSPLRNEKTPSFKINASKNTWYDYGEGKGGSIIDFVMDYSKCSIKDAIDTLSTDKIAPVKNYHISKIPVQQMEIRAIKSLHNPALCNYVTGRGIPIDLAEKYIKEIYYRHNFKNYFSVGIENDAQGYEVRNKFFKGCVGKKALTTIKGVNRQQVSIFEGFFDFLAALVDQQITRFKSDIIILHSTANLHKAIAKIHHQSYQKVFAFLDNDKTGRKALAELSKEEVAVIDMSYLYANFSDYNEKLTKQDEQ